MFPHTRHYILGLAFFFVACQPLGSKNAGSLLDNVSTAGGPLNSCLSQTKTQLLAAPTIVDSPNSKLDDVAAQYNNIITSGKLVQEEFSRNSTNSTYDSLNITRAYALGSNTIVESIDLNVVDPASDSDGMSTLSPYLGMTIASSLFQNNLEQQELIQGYSLNPAAGCQPSIINVRRGDFTYGSGSNVQLSIASDDLVNKLSTTNNATIELDAMQNNEPLDQKNRMLQQLQAQPNLKISEYNSGLQSPYTSYQTLTVQAPQTQNDPMVGQSVTFNIVSIVQLDTNNLPTTQSTMSISSASDYYQMKTNIGAMQIMTEGVTQVQWLAQQLATTDAHNPTANFKLDFSQANFTYQVTNPGALPFDNYNAYFGFTLLSAGSNGNPYDYQVQYQRSTAPLPASFTVPFQANTDPKYVQDLASSYYVNYSDPLVQSAIANIRSSLGNNYTYQDLVQKIAIYVVGAIKYDYNALQNNSVTLIRASDALQRGSGVCENFATVFVAIARGLQLPARVIDGYSLGTKSDGTVTAGNHAWVEVLINGQTWWPIEPQAGSLTYIQYFPTYFPLVEDIYVNSSTPSTAGLLTYYQLINSIQFKN